MSSPQFTAPSGIPDLTLERYRLGELAPDRMSDIETRLRADAALGERLAAIDQADEHSRRDYSPDDLTRDIRRRLNLEAVRPAGNRLGFVWLVPVATTVLVVLAAGAWWQAPWPSVTSSPPSGVDGDRPKGAEAALFVYRNNNAGVERLTDHDEARAGDVVRLGYRVARPVYGAIVSIDGLGGVTRHLPDEGAEAVRLEPGSTVLLNRAFELDDAPDVERFFLIAAPEPFDLERVLEAVRATARSGAPDPTQLDLPSSFTSTVFSLRKDSRP